MVFKLLLLLSLVLESVFLDAIGLVEYEHEISSLDKLEWGSAERSVFIRAVLLQLISVASVGFSFEVNLVRHEGQFVSRCFIRIKN